MALILAAAALILSLGALGLALVRRARLEEELRELAGRAALGSLVPGLAHRWRQPLNLLSLALQAMELELESGKPERSALEGPLRRGLDEIEGLDRLLDDYRRLAAPPAEPAAGGFLLRELLELCLRLEAPRLGRQRVRAELSCPEGLSLKAEPGLLAAVVIGFLEEGLAGPAGEGGLTLLIGAEPEGRGLRLSLGLSVGARGTPGRGESPPALEFPRLIARRGLGARVSRTGDGGDLGLVLHLPKRLLA